MRSKEYFDLTYTVLPLRGLSREHEGVVVAQLSDLHVGTGTPSPRIRAAISAVNRAKPDLVFLTGDFVTHVRYPLPLIPEVLAGLEPPTYAVLGNHDHFVGAREVRAALVRLGYAVLQNESAQVTVRDRPLSLIGVDDAVTHHDDVSRSLRDAPRDGTRLVLAHAPTTARDLPGDAGLACFSGHTHGGQLHVKRLTARISAALGQPYLRGLYSVRDNWLYVNRGLAFGRGSLVPRIDSEPEVALFELRAA
jgi:predicted MPP superfamily phosphohydrolase